MLLLNNAGDCTPFMQPDITRNCRNFCLAYLGGEMFGKNLKEIYDILCIDLQSIFMRILINNVHNISTCI